ncbi:MAG: Ig-like domain-containing protein [Fuerstiella sp.]
MSKSLNRNLNIEILEPLVLMSASPADCEIVNLFDCGDGGHDFGGHGSEAHGLGSHGGASEAIQNLRSVWANCDGDDHSSGRGDGLRDNNCDSDGKADSYRGADWTLGLLKGKSNDREQQRTSCFDGQRSEYTVEDQGFGIFAVAGRGCVDFLSDITHLEFFDGKFDLANLLSGCAEDPETVVAEIEDSGQTDETTVESSQNAGEQVWVSADPPWATTQDAGETDEALTGDVDLIDNSVVDESETTEFEVINDGPVLIEDGGLLPTEPLPPVYPNGDTGTFILPADVSTSVSFVSEGAGYQNTIGMYSVDPATGAISDVRILFANASEVGSGGSLLGGETVSFSGGQVQPIGFFILANGNSLNDIQSSEDSSLALQQGEDGNLHLVATDADGNSSTLNGPVYTSEAERNPAGLDHFRIEPNGTGYSINIEDLPALGDHDFDDVVLTLNIEPDVFYPTEPPVVEPPVVEPPVVPEGPTDLGALYLPADVGTTISFISEGAGYQNTVGIYEIDPSTGEISDVRILFGNASAQGSGGSLVSGDSVSFSGGQGNPIGFFILANGNQLNNLSAIEGSSLQLQPDNDGVLKLTAVQPNGQTTTLNGPVYVSDASRNPGGLDHFQIEPTDSGYSISIEDLPGLGDRDFDDVVLQLNVFGGYPVSPEPPVLVEEPVPYLDPAAEVQPEPIECQTPAVDDSTGTDDAAENSTGTHTVDVEPSPENNDGSANSGDGEEVLTESVWFDGEDDGATANGAGEAEGSNVQYVGDEAASSDETDGSVGESEVSEGSSEESGKNDETEVVDASEEPGEISDEIADGSASEDNGGDENEPVEPTSAESTADGTEYIYNYNVVTPEGSDAGGDIQQVSTSYNSTTNAFSFRVVIADAVGNGRTNGFTLAINDGPNPKGHGDEMALFYFDNSGSQPVVTAYNYNGQNDFSSYQDEALVSSLSADSPFTSIEASYDENGNHVFSFNMNATSIVQHSDGEDWTGVSFNKSLGMWLHPMTNVNTTYGDDGYLDSWSFSAQGWFDTKDQVAEEVVLFIAPEPEPQPEPECPVDPNDVPIAENDTNVTAYNSPAFGSVAGNDSDPDGDFLTFTLSQNAANGLVTLEADGSYVYTPNDGFAGEDSFSYQVDDGNGGTAIATVSILVEPELIVDPQPEPEPGAPMCPVEAEPVPENQAPDAVNDVATTDYETSVSGQVLDNDIDPDGNTLTTTLLNEPANGTVSLNEDGSYTYTPDQGFSGTDTFTYEVSDGNGGTDTAEVVIEVCPAPNSGPDAQDDSNATNENVAVSGSVAGNDSDADGDSLTFSVDQGPANGSLQFNTDGSYTYTPYQGFSGTDTFTYEVSDGKGGLDTALVIINVEPAVSANENPDSVGDSAKTDFNTTVTGKVLCNDEDPDGDALAVTGFTNPENGTVTVTAGGRYTYTPNDGFSGTDTFTYSISDGKGGTNTATVTIEVCPPPEPPAAANDNPDAVDDSNSTAYETSVSGNVLPNDSDPNNDQLTVSLIEEASNGNVTVNPSGQYVYTPDAGFSGQDTFTSQIDDGNGGTDTAVVTITVDSAPNTISATDDDYVADNNSIVTGNVLDNDFDPDGDTLSTAEMTDVRTSEGGTVTLYSDGSFVYTPAINFTGTDSFVYESSDGNGNVTTANVKITVQDAPAVPVDDGYTGDAGAAIKGNVTLNDIVDGQDVKVVLVSGPTNGTLELNNDGTFRYLANDGFSGQDTFSYSLVVAGSVTQSAQVKLVLAEVNYDTTYNNNGQDGLIWGDPHFRGDDGGLFDVQGEAGHIYNLLSDSGLQVNAKFVHWNDIASDGTVIGELGVTVGLDKVHLNFSGATLNGIALTAGSSTAIDGGTVSIDGDTTTLITSEYQLQFIKQDGLFSVRIKVINPFSDLVAPHGLWGQTVDGDTDARNGDFYKENYDYGLQGGGALDKVDSSGTIVRTERGDQTSYQLYETAELFSTTALYSEGELFFRYNARQGTGLKRI